MPVVDLDLAGMDALVGGADAVLAVGTPADLEVGVSGTSPKAGYRLAPDITDGIDGFIQYGVAVLDALVDGVGADSVNGAVEFAHGCGAVQGPDRIELQKE